MPLDLSVLKGRSVLVIGDVMLDEYISGTVRRVSPEAPVPVVETERVECLAGGAANVAVNIAALEGVSHLAGVVGSDGASLRLCAVLDEKGVDSRYFQSFDNRRTTVKTRVIAHGQQMLRLDSETARPLNDSEEEAFLVQIVLALKHVDACVLSDYAKGVLTQKVCQVAIAKANERRIPIVVDPKGTNYAKYRGATVITPNLTEAMSALGVLKAGLLASDQVSDQDVEQFGMQLGEQCDSQILITRGAKGMSLIRAGETALHIASQAHQVYDVTGAGDTVVAMLSLSLAAGFSPMIAASLANVAAGVVVNKLGTATVTLPELEFAARSIL